MYVERLVFPGVGNTGGLSEAFLLLAFQFLVSQLGQVDFFFQFTYEWNCSDVNDFVLLQMVNEIWTIEMDLEVWTVEMDYSTFSISSLYVLSNQISDVECFADQY